MLTDTKRKYGIEMTQKDDTFWYPTSRDSVGEACVMSMCLNESKNKIFDIQEDKNSKSPQSEEEWKKIFTGFKSSKE